MTVLLTGYISFFLLPAKYLPFPFLVPQTIIPATLPSWTSNIIFLVCLGFSKGKQNHWIPCFQFLPGESPWGKEYRAGCHFEICEGCCWGNIGKEKSYKLISRKHSHSFPMLFGKIWCGTWSFLCSVHHVSFSFLYCNWCKS